MTSAANPDVELLPLSDTREPIGAKGVAWRAAVWLLLLVITAASLYAGVKLRQWTWEMTEPIHFRSDINRGYNWGKEAATNGYLNLYEKMASQEPDWNNWLDYAPLRLAVMTGWGHYTKAHFANPDGSLPNWRHEYEFNRFVLMFNTGMELLGAVCAFLLTRLWVKRSRGPNAPPFTGFIPATLAGLFFWFNPAILLSAHGWPTWDMWIMPMYLLAVLMASHDKWFIAGLVIAAGAMFKGQQWAVAAMFVIWPIVMGRFDAALKWAIGALFGVGILASPWLLSYVEPSAIEAIRKIQFDGRGAPWDASRLKLPDRIIDRPAVVWVGALALVAMVLPLVLGWVKRREADVEISESDSTELPARFRSRPTAMRRAVAMYQQPGRWRIVMMCLPWVIALLAFGALHEYGRGKLDLTLWPLRAIQATFLLACPLAVLLTIAIARPHVSFIAKLAIASIGFIAFAWPALLDRNRAEWFLVAIAATVFAALLPIVRPRQMYLLLAAGVGLALLWCQTLFNGSSAWWICGWKYGTIHWNVMVMGVTSNLPGILKERYNWPHPNTLVEFISIPPEILFGYPKAEITFTIKKLMATIFMITLVLSSIGVGLHAKRRDPRVLVAFTAPWLMFFCFPTQIHERYLLYAATIGAITIGAGAGPWLICTWLSIVTWMMTIHVMLNGGNRREWGRLLHEWMPSVFEPSAGDTIRRVIQGTYPDIGWSILLCAGVFLYLSLTPSRRKGEMLS